MPLPIRVSDPTGPGKSDKKSAPDGRNSVAFLKGNAANGHLGDDDCETEIDILIVRQTIRATRESVISFWDSYLAATMS